MSGSVAPSRRGESAPIVSRQGIVPDAICRSLSRCAVRCALLALKVMAAPLGPALAAEPALTVAAAANLQPVLEEAQRRYEAETGVRITLAFGASGSLAQQIENGAPYHLFLSADESWMARLAGHGAIDPASVQPFAEGRLVLVLAKGAFPAGAEVLDAPALALLRGPEIRFLALANPRTAPFGHAAREALERAGIWEALQPRIVFAENIRQTLQFVESGNAEAGLVAQSLVVDRALTWRPVDPGLYTPLRQTLGLVRGAPAEARRLAEWLLSAPGQQLVARFGYAPARPALVEGAR